MPSDKAERFGFAKPPVLAPSSTRFTGLGARPVTNIVYDHHTKRDWMEHIGTYIVCVNYFGLYATQVVLVGHIDMRVGVRWCKTSCFVRRMRHQNPPNIFRYYMYMLTGPPPGACETPKNSKNLLSID